jgi:polyketide synthase PksN
MAAYYVHIIQSVLPEGAADLGGYSLGGMLAYEITRQLQELGGSVPSLVMLDAYDTTGFKGSDLAGQEVVLSQSILNFALQSTLGKSSGNGGPRLIHRDELDAGRGVEAVIEQLIALAKARGLTQSEAQLRTMIRQLTKVHQAYEPHRFSLLPLPRPEEVTGYYFRNKNGRFLGDLAPYYSPGDEIAWDHLNYWSEWEQHLPNLHMMDLDVSNHMVMLSESKSYETIAEFCETLYSEPGISPEFLDAFKRKVEERHGLKLGF